MFLLPCQVQYCFGWVYILLVYEPLHFVLELLKLVWMKYFFTKEPAFMKSISCMWQVFLKKRSKNLDVLYALHTCTRHFLFWIFYIQESYILKTQREYLRSWWIFFMQQDALVICEKSKVQLCIFSVDCLFYIPKYDNLCPTSKHVCVNDAQCSLAW